MYDQKYAKPKTESGDCEIEKKETRSGVKLKISKSCTKEMLEKIKE